jgi:hypothetical protein
MLIGVAAAGCSASSPSTAMPPWAAGLGPGVKITPPGPHPPPGQASPGAVVEALIADINGRHYVRICDLSSDPRESRNECKAGATQATGDGQQRSGSLKNFRLGYIATDGSRALVGTTGTSCSEGRHCLTSSDPAAIFSSGRRFSTLYRQAVAAAKESDANYALLPTVRVGGSWYLEG